MSALNALLFTLGPRGVIMHLEYTISVMAHLRATVNGRFSEMKLAMRLSVVVVAQSGGQSVAEMELASFGIKLDIQQWKLSAQPSGFLTSALPPHPCAARSHINTDWKSKQQQS